MSNAKRYINIGNINQKVIKNRIINPSNNHLGYQQKKESNINNNNKVYSKNNNYNKRIIDVKQNSFNINQNNIKNPKNVNNNVNLNNTAQSLNTFKNQNIINISNSKKGNNNNFYQPNSNLNVKNQKNNVAFNNMVNKNDLNKNEMNNEKIKDYIIYLKNNLNSSYYANNDLNNEYNKMVNKSKEVNESINNKNDLFLNMNKLHEANLAKNKNFKKEYLDLVDKYKINHLNEQSKLKELNQMVHLQDNDIIKLEKENNILNEDTNNKKKIIDNLKSKIDVLKNKKNILEANDEYLYLFNKKNILITLNEKLKVIKRIKCKNDELLNTMNNLKNNLIQKENIIIKSKNIHNELSNKLIQLTNEEEMENENIKRKNKMKDKNIYNLNRTYEKLDNISYDNNNDNLNLSYELENKDFLNEMEKDLYRTYNQQFGNNINNENDYQKLIEEESKKEGKINEKMKYFEVEIAKLKNEINEIKSKNNEELSLFKQYINNLSPNDEEIRKKLISNKKNMLNQKDDLIKYNKKFKESLSEKKDLKNKINQLKIENKKIEIKITEKQKTIGFKIKAIKIRRGEGYNKNGKGIERNLSDPDLIKNNNLNDRLYISQNREHFIPAKDIYRYKKFEYKYRNEKKLLNRFKSRKSSSFDNIFKYNANNKIEKESNIDILNTPRGGPYLYTINKEGNLLGYGINLKKYVYINTSSIKGWRLFFKEYKNNGNGSLLLNTLAGLFILTGDNYNHLYYYSQSKNIIYLIMILKYNHKYGGLILTKDNNKIIILGGIYTNEVELFNIQKNSLKKLPNLLSKRINSSYNIINNQFLLTFFGKNNNTIEYLDLKNPKSWMNFEFKSNNNIEDLSGHIGFHVNENVVIIVGGLNNDKIMVFYFKEKFIDVTDFILSFDIDCGIDELIFDKEKCFNVVENKEKISVEGKDIKEIMGMDNFGNVHCFDNDYSYTIFVF